MANEDMANEDMANEDMANEDMANEEDGGFIILPDPIVADGENGGFILAPDPIVADEENGDYIIPPYPKFKVKIKDSSGQSEKYIEWDLSLDGTGFSFSCDSASATFKLTDGTNYVSVDARGTLQSGTTTVAMWTLSRSSMKCSTLANGTTYFLEQSSDGTRLVVGPTGHTVTTESAP